MDARTETTHTYYLEFDDTEMNRLWHLFDLARDTIMRLPDGSETTCNAFMTEVESMTGRHTPVSGIQMMG